MRRLIKFIDVILTGLIAGIIFGIWIGYNPQGLSAVAYVEQQQNAIRALNILMPVLGLISIILTVSFAILCKENQSHRMLLLIAAALLVVAGLVTRFGNQPINAVVITWNLDKIPNTWTALRDQWWTFHIIRTLSTMTGFALIVWVTINDKINELSV